MEKAYIYARYSTDKQTEQSIEGQIRVIKEYAKKLNIVIVDTFIDRALSAKTDNRPAFQTMIKQSNKKLVDYVIVYKLDRFARNRYDSAIYKSQLRKNNIRLISATENISNNPEGVILESMLEGMAEYYSLELSQKVKRGMNETALKGKFTGGTVTYGYKIVNGYHEIDIEQAKVVNEIFDMYLAGTSITDILKVLNQRGIKNNRNSEFKKHFITNCIKNKKYIGIYKYGSIEIENKIPAIVDIKKFKTANKKLKSNKRKTITYNNDSSFLLSGKTLCGLCGKNLGSENGTSKSGKTYRYYKCFNKKCDLKAIRKELLESTVLKNTISFLDNSKLINKIAVSVVEYNKIDNENNSILTELIRQKEHIEKSIKNIIDAIENGLFNNMMKTRLSELETDLTKVNYNISKEKKLNRFELNYDDVLSYINMLLKNGDLKQVIFDTFIKKVVLYKDKLVIFFNYNENSEGIECSYLDTAGLPQYSYANTTYFVTNNSFAIIYER